MTPQEAEALCQEAREKGVTPYLRGANLSFANLFQANFSDANLTSADFRVANLRWANFSGAILSDACFRNADLGYANLSVARLSGANLMEAILPSPTMVLLAYWGTVSDELCVRLMRYDASNHPCPQLFDKWAEGGECPYVRSKFQRAANFQEKRSIWPGWNPEEPVDSAFTLMLALFEEKSIKWTPSI